MAETRFIIFRVAGADYSFELSYVNGIEENYNVVGIPNCPDNIKGIINLRGVAIPVYSLRSRFGKPEERGAKKLVLARIREMTIGFEVDSIVRIEDVDVHNILEVPVVVKTEDTSYMNCIINTSEGIVINLSVRHLLSDEAFDDITEILNKQNEGEEND